MSDDEKYAADGIEKNGGLFEVGCRQCGEGGSWKIYSGGENIVKAECGLCGHSIQVQEIKITRRPDLKAYDLRMFT